MGAPAFPPSITRHFGVDEARPFVDAARHTLRPGKSILPEPFGDSQAAAAVVAVDDELSISIWLEFRYSLLYLAHWQEAGGINSRDGVLVGLTTIDQGNLITLIK
jgi:hypothetical protein